MQRQTRAWRDWVSLVLFWLAFAVGMAAWRSQLKPPPDAWMLNLTNNPDKFFLWGTNANINYTFTYDPHAADEWRFEIGGSLMAPAAPAAPVFLELQQGK
jgi:hypothetical protein